MGRGNKRDNLHFLRGKFIRQIGKDAATKGPRSGETARLNRPAHMFTDDAANEIYVADGYGNRRVIVFDSKTGAYKRHWGAYGNAPNDDKQAAYSPTAEPSKQFSNPVHCVRVSNDGLVYVCDRANDRIQVFRKDGTFVKEFRVEPATLQNGSVWDLVLSEETRSSASSSSPMAPMGRSCRSCAKRRAAHPWGPPRPPAGAVQVGAQHGYRFERQPVHRRCASGAGCEFSVRIDRHLVSVDAAVCASP